MLFFRFFTVRVKIHHFSNKNWDFLQSLNHSSGSWEITLLHFFSWNFICYWQSSTWKCKFSNLLLLALKFTKFVISFLKPRASFSSNFASVSSVMRDNSSVLFHLKLFMLSTKGTHQVKILRLSTARMKINQISCHFSSHHCVKSVQIRTRKNSVIEHFSCRTQVSFHLDFHQLSVPWHVIPLKFSS